MNEYKIHFTTGETEIVYADRFDLDDRIYTFYERVEKQYEAIHSCPALAVKLIERVEQEVNCFNITVSMEVATQHELAEAFKLMEGLVQT